MASLLDVVVVEACLGLGNGLQSIRIVGGHAACYDLLEDLRCLALGGRIHVLCEESGVCGGSVLDYLADYPIDCVCLR